MVNATAGKREARLEVVRLQIGHFVKNLRGIETRRKKVENIGDTNTHPAHTRAASALHRINGDSVE